MRTIPPALQTALQSDVLTLAWCVRLTRQDGVSFGFTEHDAPLTVGGVLCEPSSGANLSSLVSGASMAVDNSQMKAFLDSEKVTENDLLRGVYDGAQLVISVVDWTTPTNEIIIASGYVGEVSSGDTEFTTEFQ